MNFPSIADHGGSYGSGGLKINGVEETYTVASGETIKAGDFVRFLNGYKSNPITKNLEFLNYSSINNSRSESDYNIEKVIYLNENTALLVNSSTSYIYGRIVTVSNGTINFGNMIALYGGSSSQYSSLFFDIVTIDTNKLLLVVSRYNSAGEDYMFDATVISISGTTITSGGTYTLDTPTFYCNKLICAVLSPTRVIVGRQNSGNNIKFNLLSISGSTITSLTFISYGNYISDFSITSLTSTQFLLLYYTSSGSALIATVFTVSDSSITTTKDNTLYSSISSIGQMLPMKKLSSTSVLAVFYYNNNSATMLLNISGDMVTTPTGIVVISSITQLYTYGFETFDNTNFFYFSIDSSYKLLIFNVSVVGNSITVASNYYTYGSLGSSNGAFTSCLGNLNTKSVFFFYYTTTNYLYCVFLNTILKVIHGIAKTSGTAGQQIKVITYN